MPNLTYLKWLLAAPVASLLVACVTTSPYPLNMTEEQWSKLSPSERKTLLLEQQKQDEHYRLEQMRTEQLRLERQRQAELQAEIEEHHRLERERYRNHEYDRDYKRDNNKNQYYPSKCAEDDRQRQIEIGFVKGKFSYNNKHFRIEQASYNLKRGETKKIQLALYPKKDKNGGREKNKVIYKSAYLKYAKNGQHLYLYLKNPKRKPKNKITLTKSKNWRKGMTLKKELHSNAGNLTQMVIQVKQTSSKCGQDKLINRYKTH